MGERAKNAMAFLLGMFIGRYGIPIVMHVIYLAIIFVLLFARR